MADQRKFDERRFDDRLKELMASLKTEKAAKTTRNNLDVVKVGGEVFTILADKRFQKQKMV